MTWFWLVRHGQTDWNVAGRWQGQSPEAPPLNAVGRAQAKDLAAFMRRRPWAALYSSDLRRAQETANFIAMGTAAPVIADPRLREVNLGAWEGLLGDEIAQHYPAELAERRAHPLEARPPGGGETAEEVVRRVRAAADEIAQRHPAEEVVIVSHGLALAALLCLARGRPLAEIYQHIPENAQPVRITWPPGQP